MTGCGTYWTAQSASHGTRGSADLKTSCSTPSLHNLVVIGEAVRGLSEDCREREPDVRWSAIVDFADTPMTWLG